MKRIFTYTLLATLMTSFALTSCVKAKPGCKKNHKKIKKMRKNNPNFTM